MAVITVTIILAVAIILLVTEKLPIDLTALCIMAVLMLLRILTPAETLAGFANPAPVTIALLFVVSSGLMRSGALDLITERIIRFSKGKPNRLLFIILFLVGGFSSFLNNTPVVVLFISITMMVCCEYSLSPSKFLMPISFVSILAGTSTLIGTSTNIIVGDLAAQNGLTPIGMFELSLLGMPAAMAGAIFLYLLSPRVLPSHKEPVCELGNGERHSYISELYIPADSPFVGCDAAQSFRERFPDIELFEVIRGINVIDLTRTSVIVEKGDVLLVKATVQQLTQILDNRCALLPEGDKGTIAQPYDRGSVIVELLVPPNSDAVGQMLSDFIAALDVHVRILGIKRHWKHYQIEKVRKLRLAVGDIILAQIPLDHLEQIRGAQDLLVFENVHRTIINRKKAPIAAGIFLGMIFLATVGLIDILVAATVAAVAMILTGCIGLREAYRSIDVRVLLLIIGTLALGTALNKTGAADIYARTFLAPLVGFSPWVVLSAFILLTSVVSLLISNNTTAALLVPIAISTASAINVDPRPFIIGICFGASACFATPIGYQTNLLVYGPGGYGFKDYLKLGIPLTIWIWVVSSIFIPIIWPL